MAQQTDTEEQEKYAERFAIQMERMRKDAKHKKLEASPSNLLGYAFTRSPQSTVEAAEKALNHKGGKLSIVLNNSGAEPSLLERIRLGAISRWFTPHNIKGLTPEFIQRNANFSKYKNLLKSKGIQIENINVIPAADGAGIRNPYKAATAGLATLSAAGVIAIPLGTHWQLHAAAGTIALAIPAITALNKHFKIDKPADTTHKIEIQLAKSEPAAPAP
jgi:hypothetical protein